MGTFIAAYLESMSQCNKLMSDLKYLSHFHSQAHFLTYPICKHGPHCIYLRSDTKCLSGEWHQSCSCPSPFRLKMTFSGSVNSRRLFFFLSGSFSLTLCHSGRVCVGGGGLCVCAQACNSLRGCLASTLYHISFSPLPQSYLLPDCFAWMDDCVKHLTWKR